jgi:16S rRNA (cytosine967-C5)-methyltransferase
MTDNWPGKQLKEKNFWDSPRCRIWHTIWAELCEHAELPQVDRWLAARLKKDRRFGQKDRRWYAEATFRALRYGIWAVSSQKLLESGQDLRNPSYQMVLSTLGQQKYPSQWWSLLQKLDGGELVFWLAAREQGSVLASKDASLHEAAEHVWQFWVDIAQKPLDFEGGAELTQLQLLWFGLPASLYAELERRIKASSWNEQQAKEFLHSQTTRAPLWLRLNDMRLKDKVISSLEDGKLNVFTDFNEQSWSLRAEGNANLYRNESYLSGHVEIQDRASQLIGETLDIKRGQYIWDACAGGGGKTMQLAARLKGSGAVYASDVRSYKLDEVKRRAKRAGFSNIRYLPWDGKTAPSLSSELRKKGGFDIILIDAPCSSSGTWRRNPDGRYRLKPEFLQNLAEIQYGIFERVWPLLKDGGQLVYATCSWLVDENEAVIESWLKQNPELVLESMGMIGTPYIDADAMFVASLKKSTIKV